MSIVETGRQETDGNGGEEQRHHARCRTVHVSVRMRHALASEIYLWTHVGQAPVHVGQTEMRLVEAESGETHEHDGVGRVRVDLPEVDKFGFEKTKFKNSKKEVGGSSGA